MFDFIAVFKELVDLLIKCTSTVFTNVLDQPELPDLEKVGFNKSRLIYFNAAYESSFKKIQALLPEIKALQAKIESISDVIDLSEDDRSTITDAIAQINLVGNHFQFILNRALQRLELDSPQVNLVLSVYAEIASIYAGLHYKLTRSAFKPCPPIFTGIYLLQEFIPV